MAKRLAYMQILEAQSETLKTYAKPVAAGECETLRKPDPAMNPDAVEAAIIDRIKQLDAQKFDALVSELGAEVPGDFYGCLCARNANGGVGGGWTIDGGKCYSVGVLGGKGEVDMSGPGTKASWEGCLDKLQVPAADGSEGHSDPGPAGRPAASGTGQGNRNCRTVIHKIRLVSCRRAESSGPWRPAIVRYQDIWRNRRCDIAEAVRLARTSGRTQREVADELGIGLSTLVRSAQSAKNSERIDLKLRARFRQNRLVRNVSRSGRGDRVGRCGQLHSRISGQVLPTSAM